MPAGFLTQDGPRPDFAELYGAAEMPTPSYQLRTHANVMAADATLWFGRFDTAGARATLIAINEKNCPRFVVTNGSGVRASKVANWIYVHDFDVLNVAGNRESLSPGIGARVEAFMREVFRRLGYHRIDGNLGEES